MNIPETTHSEAGFQLSLYRLLTVPHGQPEPQPAEAPRELVRIRTAAAETRPRVEPG
jgi:hypothetical protein